MLCYRDKTWCEESACARFGVDCTRALTEEVKKTNTTGLPYAIFGDRPTCYQPKDEKKPNLFREK